MDPNETLNGALRALANGDIVGCTEYLVYYREWREKGGFQPPRGDERFRLIEQLRTIHVTQAVGL